MLLPKNRGCFTMSPSLHLKFIFQNSGSSRMKRFFSWECCLRFWIGKVSDCNMQTLEVALHTMRIMDVLLFSKSWDFLVVITKCAKIIFLQKVSYISFTLVTLVFGQNWMP